MSNKLTTFFLFCITMSSTWAKSNHLDTISIGNVRVAIHPSAKPILDKEFAMLGANKKYVASVVDKMRMYFPVIEPILMQGNVPADFKYLCMQESGFNPNAVSTSAAVGYWQFKLETAKDVGLKVDHEIDERRHVLESTKGAVNYFTRNNAVLHNWMSTLLSYRVGLGAIKKLPYSANWADKTTIEVDSSTDWYVLRFLAYKEFWSGQLASQPINVDAGNLITYQGTKGKNLYDVSDELKISYDDLKRYNAWILKDWIPEDKGYTIYHPSNLKTFDSAELPIFTASIDTTKLYQPSPARVAKTKNKQILSDQFEVKVHTVSAGDNLSSIASTYEMKLADLLKLNKLDITSMITIGQKINVSRRIPMLEIITQKLDLKSSLSPRKELANTTVDIQVEEEDVRKINTKQTEKSFYIAPAETREIVELKEETPRALPSEPKNETFKPEVKRLEPVTQKPVPDARSLTSDVAQRLTSTTHTVLAGETLFKIAKTYGLSVAQLIEWNKLGNKAIQVGQKLSLKP